LPLQLRRGFAARAGIPAEPPAWPDDLAFIDLRSQRQLTRPGIRCVRLAVCDGAGNFTMRLKQGCRVHLFYEFAVSRQLRSPTGGAGFADESGAVIHGKSTFQYDLEIIPSVPAGSAVRFHHSFTLVIAPGRYTVFLGLGDVDPEWLRAYRSGEMPYSDFATRSTELCRVQPAVAIEVVPRPDGSVPHHGLVNLPGSLELSVAEAQLLEIEESAAGPTLFHVTHWKAGSQWLLAILRECAPAGVVDPLLDQAQVRYAQIQPGAVYPTVYLTRQEMESIALPPDSRIFVVIRDLRDTLVSAYYSFKISHPVLEPGLAVLRAQLNDLDEESGMMQLLEFSLPKSAAIQLSWLESGAIVAKFEDLRLDTHRLLTEILLDRLKMPISRERLARAIDDNRFEKLSGGRAPGQEDPASHLRKGVAGDWQNHFTDRMKRAFKARYGGLLVAAGYEKDLNW
jgi:lipopolysaccharide transport system ATP-binding protein